MDKEKSVIFILFLGILGVIDFFKEEFFVFLRFRFGFEFFNLDFLLIKLLNFLRKKSY